MADYEKAYEYLLKSKKFYDAGEFGDILKVRYHRTWSYYYYCRKMWSRCIEEIDNALSFSDNRQPLGHSKILKKKAMYIDASGDYRTALDCYKTSLSYADSIYRDFILKQDKAIKDNYRWEMGLVKKARENARIAAQKASDAALLKDNYLKNVRKEILSPLDQINTSLESNDMDKVGELSSSLESLLDKILDLTYLESGQMKFDVKEYDVLALCYDLQDLVKESKDERVEVNFSSSVDSQMIKMDYGRFMDYLLPAFVLPKDYKLSETIDFNLSYGETGEEVILSLFATPLANIQFESQMQSLQNQINKLFFESFGGSYHVSISKLRPELIIKLHI